MENNTPIALTAKSSDNHTLAAVLQPHCDFPMEVVQDPCDSSLQLSFQPSLINNGKSPRARSVLERVWGGQF